MPVIAGLAAALEPRAPGRHVVRIVESDQARAVRRVEGERVGQAVRPFRGRLDEGDFELEPVALLEVMNAPIERQQELEAMVDRASTYII
jgi:hypothetical protein